jgi:hypothetical protein
MTSADRRGVVIDTMVFGWMFVEHPSAKAERSRRLDLPLVSDDGILKDAPGVRLITADDAPEQ